MNSEKAKNLGFTLIETIVVIAIFTLMISAISVVFISLYRSQKNDIGLIERSRNAGRAIDIMTNEIRKANRGRNGNFCLETAEEQRVVFYSDVDGDDYTEKITYVLDGTDLKKTVVEAGTDLSYSETGTEIVLCEGVWNGSDPIFFYYDENYTGVEDSMSSPVDNVAVRTVGISLDVNTDNSGLEVPLHIETKVQMRNLK